jgi:phospho-N-acetylmuramoyl-pentapeptide-transferase
MLYNFIYPFYEHFAVLNVLKYISVRSGAALFMGFFVVMLIGPGLIRRFKGLQQAKKTVRDDHPEASVLAKQGTPTMGGLMIIIGLLVNVMLWTDLTQPLTWLVSAVIVAVGLVGFTDDYCGMTGLWKKGVPGRVRLAIQFVVCCSVLFAWTRVSGDVNVTVLHFPFFKDLSVDLGLIGYMLFGTLVMIGCANAVNLTDGLDGLVSIPAVFAAASLAFIAYAVGRVDFTEYLHIPYVAGAGEMTIVCSALIGSILGFLWFNAPPARIFMGDTGSLVIGGTLGFIAVVVKHEITFAIIAGLFVIEALSVMIQVGSFKLRGKRVFRRAPIHHHFEQLGWPETTIVVRFWIISLLFAVIGLATLKLR